MKISDTSFLKQPPILPTPENSETQTLPPL